MLTSLIRALRGPYQVRVSFACGSTAVPTGCFLEICGVFFWFLRLNQLSNSCFSATVKLCFGEITKTAHGQRDGMGGLMAFMLNDTQSTGTIILPDVLPLLWHLK